MLLLASNAAATVKLSFGTPQDLGAGRYTSWSLSTIYNPPTTSYNLIISTASAVLQSQDGKSWGNTYSPSNKTFDLPTPYSPPEAPPATFPLHDLGNTQASTRPESASTLGVSARHTTPSMPTALQRRHHAGVNLTFTGLPRAMGCIQTTCCNCPFRSTLGICCVARHDASAR